MKIRTYSEMLHYQTLEDRYRYLKLGGEVGSKTFGSDRYYNQKFYRSREWKNVRDFVIVRDNGCDLALDGYEIHEAIYIHHMNPLTLEHINSGDDNAFNPEFLISTTHNTHNAIHYGDENLLPRQYVPRRPGDTKLW